MRKANERHKHASVVHSKQVRDTAWCKGEHCTAPYASEEALDD
jgi:hypothetical protein